MHKIIEQSNAIFNAYYATIGVIIVWFKEFDSIEELFVQFLLTHE